MRAPHPGRPRRGPIRVLHLVSTFALKTDIKWLLLLDRHQDRARFDCEIACFHGGGPAREQFEALGVATHNLEVSDERDPRALLRAHRLIDAGAFDVVHTHLLRADLYGGLAARWSGTPVLVSTAYALGAFQRATRRRLDPVLDAVYARIPAHFLAVCDAVRDDLIRRLRVHPRRITVIRTGIEPPGDAPRAGAAGALRRAWGFPETAPVVLTLARLSYEKGVDDLIDAAAMLRATRPDARFVVLGDGPDRAALEARVAERGLSGVFALPGFAVDIWPALTAADVVCLPSKSEGLPNALLEAMAMSRPVVATAVGGMPEAIEHEVNGLLVPPGDAEALARALGRVLGDAALGARLGRAARGTVEERFLARDVAARYGELYERLFTRGGMAHACVSATTS